jgi:Poly A polymerase regulatory subunit
MLTSLDLFQKNPHIQQAIRQGGQNDENIQWEGKSEHRKSYISTPFSMELKMDGENIPDQEYVDLKSLDSSVLHWGQLKLLLGEIEFLTPYLNVENLCVVYMGSAPGHHLKVLVDLMPKTWIWELYDDRPCEVFCNDNLNDVIIEKVSPHPSRFGHNHKVVEEEKPEELTQLLAKHQIGAAYEKYKTTHYESLCQCLIQMKKMEIEERLSDQEALLKRLEEMKAPKMCLHNNSQILYRLRNTIPIARQHSPNVHVHNFYIDKFEASRLRFKYVHREQSDQDPQLLCISDIRTPMERITETSVQYDMYTQKNLLQDLGAYQASLKFKMPFSENFPLHHTYLDGKLLYQPYAPKISHECRLHTEKGRNIMNTKVYNREEYARKLFYFQTTLRTSLYHQEDPLPNEVDHPYLVSNGVATDHCFDCIAARQIIQNMNKGDTLNVLNAIVEKLIEIQIACKADGNGTLED